MDNEITTQFEINTQDIDTRTVGTTWTTLNNNTRIVTAADGGWIDGRVQWRRTGGNTFEFRMQLALNRNLSAGNLAIWFTVNGTNNGANGQAGSLNVTGQNGTVWHQVGPIWSRTSAQVGGGGTINAFGAQIRFQTGSFIFGGTQIGNGVWRTIRTTANFNTPIVLTRGTIWLNRGGIALRR